MSKERLLAYTDAVIAIIITIMVLEFKIPHEPTLHALQELIPVFISYIMSFVFISIYRNNHHHMLQIPNNVNGSVLWANNTLLFFLSLIPFCTGWMAENHFDTLPVMVYGIILLLCGCAYDILARTLLCANSTNEKFRALQGNKKGEISLVLYALGVGTTFIHPYISLVIYGIVSLMRLIPSKNVERLIGED